MEKTRRYCQQCGETLHGRRDKKFCSDYCRATYHNVHQDTPSRTIRRINSKLIRNRSILRQAIHAGYGFIPIEHLKEWGFSFEYFTHAMERRKGRKVLFCYDTAYSIDAGGMVELIDPEREMNSIIPPPQPQIADPLLKPPAMRE